MDSDDPITTAAGMDMKQIVEKIQTLEKKAYGPKNKGSGDYKQTMMLSALMILSLCIAAILLKCSQMSEEIAKMTENNIDCQQQMDEKIAKMNEKFDRKTHEIEEKFREIALFTGLDPITSILHRDIYGKNIIIHGNGNYPSGLGLVATLNDSIEGWNLVRTLTPIPAHNYGDYPPTITFYFEVKFLKKNGNIFVGFCRSQFPWADEWLGNLPDSIGIWRTGEMWIDGSVIKFENVAENFKQDDVVGLGIVHSPVNSLITKCFVTLNGKLLGKIDLPSKFVSLKANQQLFPAITLYKGGDSVSANFGKEQFLFDFAAEIFQ